MENLYHTLSLLPDATDAQIRSAILNKISNRQIPIDDIVKYKEFLLDKEKKKEYDARLLAEHPDLIQAMADDKTLRQVRSIRHSSSSPPYFSKILIAMLIALIILLIIDTVAH